MLRKFILSLTSTMCLGMAVQAQNSSHFCGTDEQHQKMKALYPQVAANELELQKQIQEQLQKMDLTRFAKKGAGVYDDVVYEIPVVVHIIHNYGAGAPTTSRVEYLPDNVIYQAVNKWNEYYLKQNADTANVVAPYKNNIKVTYNVDSLGNPVPVTPVPYIGKTNIKFALATKDPTGKPTTGITRTRSSIFSMAGDQAKLNQWSPSSYLNIWVVQYWGKDRAPASGELLAYAMFPSSAAAQPFYDGVITSAFGFNNPGTVPHEIGHWLNLSHPWGNEAIQTTCEGDDAVDDTPPTQGHDGAIACDNPVVRFDTLCARNFRDTLGIANIVSDILPRMDTLKFPSIDFKAIANINIDTVTIYPVAPVGTPFQITLRKYGFPFATYDGTVAVNNAPQRVPVNFAVPADSGYSMVMTVNPGMLRDTVLPTTSYVDSINGIMVFVNDTYQGLYNYFYNWKVTKGSVKATIGKPGLSGATPFTTTNEGICFQTFSFVELQNVNIYPTAPSGTPYTIKLTQNTPGGTVLQSFSDTVKTPYKAHAAPLGFQIKNPGNYCLSFGTNPGALREPYTGATTTTNIPAVIRFTKDTVTIGTGEGAASYNSYFYNIGVRYGFARLYLNAQGGDSVVDYPDTVNVENIMDYTGCDRMFTHGQSIRMRAALLSGTANRSHLSSPVNLVGTGVWADMSGTPATRPDLKPVPDFTVNANATFNAQMKVYGCADGLQPFYFNDRSWRDTVTAWNWTFSNGATSPTATTQNVTNRFTEPGWVTTSLTVTGNNTGDSTVTTSRSIYVADPNSMNPIGYWQEFASPEATANWPVFNYFSNPDHQWQPANVGFYDDKAIMFKNFDQRGSPAFLTGTPRGIYADFYSPAFDISGSEFGTNANLNFMSAGAWRTSNPAEMNDTLEIAYSTDCGTSWTVLKRMTKGEIGNVGMLDIPFAPLYHGDWQAQSINLPGGIIGARKERVFFRFRYIVGVSEKMTLATGGQQFASFDYFKGTGNNFYIDRISISNNPLGIAGEVANEQGMIVAPNPTSGSATVTIAGGQGEAVLTVTDVTGKVVYKTSKQLSAQGTQVEIPASKIPVKGIYLIQVVSNGHAQTQKLVVY